MTTATDFRFGFRVLDGRDKPRRLTDAGAAWAAHAARDPRCELHRECYLSAFQFDSRFGDFLTATGSTKDYAGPCWSPWLWWDIDRDGDDAGAIDAARRLCMAIIDAAGVNDADVLAFYSGRKGYHLGAPTALWMPTPGPDYHRIARRFAELIAERAGVTIDSGVYAIVQLFRAPNSRHPRTGLHKRRITVDELMHLTPDAIAQLARQPEPFDTPTPDYHSEAAAQLWTEATRHVRDAAAVLAARKAANAGPGRLNRATLDYIRDGAAQGDRHRLLYSAAANLAELGAPHALCVGLLETSALDCGLTPKDVAHAIENGWRKVQAGDADTRSDTV